MANKLDILDKKMGAKRVKKAKAKADKIITEMYLAELRKSTGSTQSDLAKKLNVSQPALSKLESQDDMQISTLSRLIDALGGNLELVAHMPDGDISLPFFRQ